MRTQRSTATVRTTATAMSPSLVPTAIRPGDRLLVSVGEALWRCGWEIDRAGFMARLERECPDALVMTGKGVRVDILQLISTSSDAQPLVALPQVSINGTIQLDSIN